MGWARPLRGVDNGLGLIGYASLFDIGLGRALTQLVAKKLGSGKTTNPRWRGRLYYNVSVGAAGSVAILAIRPGWCITRLSTRRIQPEVRERFIAGAWRFQPVRDYGRLRGCSSPPAV